MSPARLVDHDQYMNVSRRGFLALVVEISKIIGHTCMVPWWSVY